MSSRSPLAQVFGALLLAGIVATAHAADQVTFTKDVAPILFANCVSCHRPGEVAPFSLLTHAEAAKRSKMLARVTADRQMPPWKAADVGMAYAGEHRLTEAQIAVFEKWHKAGAPEGDPKTLPSLPKFTEGWQAGTPDLILEMPEDYEVGAEGRDIYRCFVLPSGLTENRYLSGIEVRAGNRRIVHHVLVHLDTSGKARELDEADPGPGYHSGGGVGFRSGGQLAGWAPGNQPRELPAGIGMLVPKGSDLVLQVHYNRNGKPEKDRTRIGLHFADKAVDKKLRLFPLIGPVRIAAGDSNYLSKATIPVPDDVTLLSIMPHMHLLGRDIRVEAQFPDGSRKTLVHVPDWDFNWQMTYTFREAVKIPRGSSIHLEARYDNSAANPRNPHNPPKPVRWGEQTSDEMSLAFLDYTLDRESLTQGKPVSTLMDRLTERGNRAPKKKE